MKTILVLAALFGFGAIANEIEEGSERVYDKTEKLECSFENIGSYEPLEKWEGYEPSESYTSYLKSEGTRVLYKDSEDENKIYKQSTGKYYRLNDEGEMVLQSRYEYTIETYKVQVSDTVVREINSINGFTELLAEDRYYADGSKKKFVNSFNVTEYEIGVGGDKKVLQRWNEGYLLAPVDEVQFQLNNPDGSYYTVRFSDDPKVGHFEGGTWTGHVEKMVCLITPVQTQE